MKLSLQDMWHHCHRFQNTYGKLVYLFFGISGGYEPGLFLEEPENVR